MRAHVPSVRTMTDELARRCDVVYASPAAMYLAGLADGVSRITQSRALLAVLRVVAPATTIDAFQWHKVSYEVLISLRNKLAQRFAPATANRYLAALRGTLRAAWKMQLLSTDEWMRLVDFPDVRGYRLTRRRALEQEEMRRLFDAAAAGRYATTRRQDAAMLAILYGTGLRRAELAMLHTDTMHFEGDGAIRLRVVGKGNKERDVWVPRDLAPFVREWLQYRANRRGWLFPRPNGRAPMCPDVVSVRVKRLARKAGIGHVTAHDLRRTCFSTLLDVGVDLALVQRLAGHSDIATTAKYDLRGERAVKAAVERLPVPSKVTD